MKNDFCEEYEKAFPKAVECLEEDLKILFSSMPLRNWTVARHQAQTHWKGLTVKFADVHLLSVFFLQQILI